MTRRSYGARPVSILISFRVLEILVLCVVVEENIVFVQNYHTRIMMVLTADLPHDFTAECSALAKMSFGLHAR
jgi:hypothetical protein